MNKAKEKNKLKNERRTLRKYSSEIRMPILIIGVAAFLFLLPAFRLHNMTLIGWNDKAMIFFIIFLIIIIFLWTINKLVIRFLQSTYSGFKYAVCLTLVVYEFFILSNSFFSAQKTEIVKAEIIDFQKGRSGQGVSFDDFWVDIRCKNVDKSFFFTSKAKPYLSKGNYILLTIRKGFWNFFIVDERTASDGETH